MDGFPPPYLFRGTTEGFEGRCYTRQGLTPTTTDPVVATIFAQTASRHGRPVVHVIPTDAIRSTVQELRIRSGLVTKEAEVLVALAPLEIASRSVQVAAGRAKSILEAEFGIEFPLCMHSLADLDSALELAQRQRLSAEAIDAFVRLVGGQQ